MSMSHLKVGMSGVVLIVIGLIILNIVVGNLPKSKRDSIKTIEDVPQEARTGVIVSYFIMGFGALLAISAFLAWIGFSGIIMF